MEQTQNVEQTLDMIQLAGMLPGPQKPYVTYLSSNAGLVGSLGDLASKIHDGTATRNDYIDVLKDISGTATGLALLAEVAGVAAASTILPVLVGIGIGLAVLDYVDDHNYDLTEIKADLLQKLGILNDYLKDSSNWFSDQLNNIAFTVNDLWNAAQNWAPPRHDPLVLDMDGDGIETVGINAINDVVFDADGDGLKTGTGWVKADDALLVYDRNGNGTIDDGSEFFGDQTMVDGVRATDGFAALSAEDTNNDGVFDASDANYTNVRIWQDKNQDGISQSDELRTLTEAGIASISLTTTTTNKTTNGNTQTMAGSYTKTDGTIGAVGNYVFAQNGFYREFTDPLPLTDTALALPDMQGSGMVRMNNDKFKNVRRVA